VENGLINLIKTLQKKQENEGWQAGHICAGIMDGWDIGVIWGDGKSVVAWLCKFPSSQPVLRSLLTAIASAVAVGGGGYSIVPSLHHFLFEF
jgi:hypothetical protein